MPGLFLCILALAYGNFSSACDSMCNKTVSGRGQRFLDYPSSGWPGGLFWKSSGTGAERENGRGVLSVSGYSSGDSVFSGNFENEAGIFTGNGKSESKRLAFGNLGSGMYFSAFSVSSCDPWKCEKTGRDKTYYGEQYCSAYQHAGVCSGAFAGKLWSGRIRA